MVKVDVDGSAEVAWRAFEHRLTAELLELCVGDVLRVGVPIGRGTRSPIALHFRARPATLLAIATGSPPVRGAGSLPSRQPPAGIPRTKVFRIGAEPATAAWTIGALRESYDVVHPAFLTIGRQDGSATATSRNVPGSEHTATSRAPVVPATPDELEDLVERTITAVWGSPLRRDHDGDLVLEGDHGPIYVRVRRDRPVVEVFSVLAWFDRPDQIERAVAFANARNTWSSLTTYVVNDSIMFARASVWCLPYQPSNVLVGLDALLDVLREGGWSENEDQSEGAAEDADGSGDQEVADDHGRAQELEVAMLTIAHLEVAEEGSVSPALAAKIYAYDRDLLLAAIRDAETQEINWRSSIEEARQRDDDEARVCGIEATSWQRTVGLLRAALRVTIER